MLLGANMLCACVCVCVWSMFIDLLFFLLASLKVQVYTQTPGEVGKANVLLCHVSGFYPPRISVELLKNGQSLSGSLQTDLAFEKNWQYYLTKYVSFTPTKEDDYACRVTHMGESKTYIWGKKERVLDILSTVDVV